MVRLLLLGLNHATAPLGLRERLAFTGDQRGEALVALKQRFPECEGVLLSTCNRVELYVSRPVHARPRPEELVEFLSQLKNAPAGFAAHLYQKSERDVIQHLFSVASSLDSMVLGETQILGQVREAYEFAQGLGVTASGLNPLFQSAIAVGKEVMTQTPIAEGRTSVASVAVDCASRIFDHFGDKTVLSVGAGKMAALVLQGFAQLKPKRLIVANRDVAKGRALAERYSGEAHSFEELDAHLVAADIVITSTGATEPIITRGRFEHLLKQRRYRPAFLIDIALPRNVEPAVGELENVYLYNLDDLQQVIASTKSDRQQSIEQAERIVGAHVENYISSIRAREMGPTIDRLFRKHHELAKEELDRTLSRLPNLSEQDRAQLEELTRRIVNKLLHDPIKALRAGNSPHSQGTPYLHALEKLFSLGEESEHRGTEGTREEEGEDPTGEDPGS